MGHMQARLEEVFGRRLRLARKAAGLSQEGLAEKLDVSTTTVINWEKGHNSPEFARFQPLAALLHKPADWFFRESDPDDDGSGDEETLHVVLAEIQGAREQLLTAERHLVVLLQPGPHDELAARRERKAPAPMGDRVAEEEGMYTAASVWPDAGEVTPEAEEHARKAALRRRRGKGKVDDGEDSGGSSPG